MKVQSWMGETLGKWFPFIHGEKKLPSSELCLKRDNSLGIAAVVWIGMAIHSYIWVPVDGTVWGGLGVWPCWKSGVNSSEL